MKNRNGSGLEYPSGAEFAFTILDDTDDTTVANGRPVYDLLRDHGLRTTKTVWAFDTPPDNRGPYFAGETLSSPDYLEWVRGLAGDGFEIAFHNATMGSSLREDTISALSLIERELGASVSLHCNHGQNRENLHWGINRYGTSMLRNLFFFLGKFRPYPVFEGNNLDSPYYWADIADEKFSYIRAFAFRRLNGMRIPPGRPFRDPAKRQQPLFFNTADAEDVKLFNELVNPSSIDKLRQQRGWVIVSTHFGKGFYWNGRLNPEFERTIRYLSSLSGWFVPVSELLDFVKLELGVVELSSIERAWMECLHVLDRLNGRVFDSPFVPPK